MSAAKPTAARASVCVSTIMAPLDFDDEVEHSAEQLVAPPRADVSGGCNVVSQGAHQTAEITYQVQLAGWVPVYHGCVCITTGTVVHSSILMTMERWGGYSMHKLAEGRKTKIKLTGAGPVSNVSIHPERQLASILLVDELRRGSCHLSGVYDQHRAL
jgi:hypothetical protein